MPLVIYIVVENIVTYTILTKNASPLFTKIHNNKLRQPIILSKHIETDIIIKRLIVLEFKQKQLIENEEKLK